MPAVSNLPTAARASPVARAFAAAVAALGVLAALLAGAAAASAYPGAPWFEPSKPYYANFPDPDVLRVGDTYYAVGTSTGGAYLPVMSSTDLRTWDPFFNALPYPARWGGEFGSGRMTKEVWAPGIERFGNGYVVFYSIRLPPTDEHPERFCISRATASSPKGPFTDDSTGPLVCTPTRRARSTRRRSSTRRPAPATWSGRARACPAASRRRSGSAS